MFFYLYTGHVQFALLKSNRVEAHTEYTKQHWKPGNPPLCSPKSVCYLAGKVTDPVFKGAFLQNDVHQLGLQHLENAALRDVITKTSATNIVKETFSKSTARFIPLAIIGSLANSVTIISCPGSTKWSVNSYCCHRATTR